MEHIRITKPVEADPSGSGSAANSMLGEFCVFGDGLHKAVYGFVACDIGRGPRRLINIFPDHLDLPSNLIFVECLQPRLGSVEPRRRHGFS